MAKKKPKGGGRKAGDRARAARSGGKSGGKRGQKSRVDFRRNRENRVRPQNLTRQLEDEPEAERLDDDERIGRSAETRQRTLLTDEEGRLLVDEAACETGRVLQAIGSTRCTVRGPDGRDRLCTVRRTLRRIERRTRNAVVAGDVVLYRDVEADGTDEHQGVIERIEPRRTELTRLSGHRAHLIAANVDQVVIVASAADPPLKPPLIDRFVCAAERGGMEPIICINKADLVDPGGLVRVTGRYAQIGYRTQLLSASTGHGLDGLRDLLDGKESVFAGQSGVGKSSLLNRLQPGLALRTAEVSADSGKGRHTTRTASLLPLKTSLFPAGGWVVDTPGVRQMDLWGIETEGVDRLFREFGPFAAGCRFADCTHTHEDDCEVLAAVAMGLISRERYESYLRIREGELEKPEAWE